MSYLLDTNIISAVAPTAAKRPENLTHWIADHSGELFLSTITAAEILSGIEKAKRSGAVQKAGQLTQWWDTITFLYSDRILPFDLSAAQAAGQISDRARSLGLSPGFADIAIAAIASANDLTVWTRNVRHFSPLYERVETHWRQVFSCPRNRDGARAVYSLFVSRQHVPHGR